LTQHTYRHSYIMYMSYHRRPAKVFEPLAGHQEAHSIEVNTRLFALNVAATLAMSFTRVGVSITSLGRTDFLRYKKI